MRRFNLIELTVIALLLIVFLAIGLPWVLSSREDSRQESCRHNLAQIGKAINELFKANGDRFPAATFGGEKLPPEQRLAWTVPVTLVREEKGNKANFDPSVPWNKEPNLTPEIGGASFRVNPLFHCSADESDNRFSSYVGMAGAGKDAAALPAGNPHAGIFGYDRRTSLTAIGENREHRICVLETSRDNGPWTAGGPPTVRPFLPDETPFLGPGRQFGGHHAEGAAALMADFRVRVFSTKTDAEVFGRLCVIGGE